MTPAQREAAAASELRRLGADLRAIVSDGLRTIEADTAAATARPRALLLNARLRPLVASRSLSSGSPAGAGG
ncbi:MAG: hypothetical protein OXE58_16860 [Acidobacteria bacterium]|nr:hypothetical protein [Acidobacteriota bacterium]